MDLRGSALVHVSNDLVYLLISHILFHSFSVMNHRTMCCVVPCTYGFSSSFSLQEEHLFTVFHAHAVWTVAT